MLGVWCSSGFDSYGEVEDGSAVVRFPRTCWLKEAPGLDGDDLKTAALRSFRKFRGSEKNRRKREKEGIAGDDLGLLRCWGSGEDGAGCAVVQFPAPAGLEGEEGDGAMDGNPRPCTGSVEVRETARRRGKRRRRRLGGREEDGYGSGRPRGFL